MVPTSLPNHGSVIPCRQVRQSLGLKSEQASFLRGFNAVGGDKLERTLTAEGPWDFPASEGTGQDSSSLDSTRRGSIAEDGRSRCSEDSSCASAAPGCRSTSYDGGMPFFVDMEVFPAWQNVFAFVCSKGPWGLGPLSVSNYVGF